jgi:hypothetical protein
MQIDLASSEMQAALIGALVGAGMGALLAYAGGWLQSVLDRRRQRRAVATAILCEMYVAEDLARVLQTEELPGNISAHVPTQSMERFIEYAALFKPPIVASVMDLIRHTADLQRELAIESSVRGHEDLRHAFMRRLAEIVIRDVERVRPLLLEVGGQYSRPSERLTAQLQPPDAPRIGAG